MRTRRRQKPWAVWVLLMDGAPWQFGVYRGIVEAWGTARTLRGDLPLLTWKRVWIAHVDQPAHRSRGHRA